MRVNESTEGGRKGGLYSLWSGTYIYIDINTAIASKNAPRTNMFSEVEVQTFS
jgi:hypothetical protein